MSMSGVVVEESIGKDELLRRGDSSWPAEVLTERLAREGWREGALDVHALGGVNGVDTLYTS